MAEPPLAGAVQLTLAEPLPDVADTPVGVSGVVTGVMAAEVLAVPFPALLIALTLIWYVVPLVSPLAVVVSVVTLLPFTMVVDDETVAVVQVAPLSVETW